MDFKNTIIVLTSNLGSGYLLEGIDQDGHISNSARQSVEAVLQKSFRPEFLNRLDEIVFYHPLTRDNIIKILDLLIQDLQNRLHDKQLDIRLTPAAKAFVVENAYDPVYGARPLKRFLQRKVETLIARKLIAQNMKPYTTLVVDCDGNTLTVSEEY